MIILPGNFCREVDDKAAAGLSWIYRQASMSGQRMFLSGSGADEILSDYGSKGVPLDSWIYLGYILDLSVSMMTIVDPDVVCFKLI